MPREPAYLPLDIIDAFLPDMRREAVSVVARSRVGFLSAYWRAGGDAARLSPAWAQKRAGFIARHMAQVRARAEPLFDADGAPTRRHLALIAWAYSPQPRRLTRVRTNGAPMSAPVPEAVLRVWRELLPATRRAVPGIRVTICVGDPADFPAARNMAFCSVAPQPCVTVAPKLARQSAGRIRGVLAHELGHAMLIASGQPKHSERDADAAALALLGVTISYDRGMVQTTGRGTRPRPSHLPH